VAVLIEHSTDKHGQLTLARPVPPTLQAMTTRSWSDDEEDWSESGGDYGDDSEEGDDADCPECGAAIYYDLDQCPRCGHWLTEADRRSVSRGLVSSSSVRLIAAALLIVFALGLLASFMAM
jgi:hypothetical protein